MLGVQETFTPDDWKRLFDVNVFGVQRVNRAVLPHMRARGTGLLLQISSLLRRIAIPFSAMPASRRTRSATGARKPVPQGIRASGVEKPMLTLSRSSPDCLNERASSIDSAKVCSSRPFLLDDAEPGRQRQALGPDAPHGIEGLASRKRLRLGRLPAVLTGQGLTSAQRIFHELFVKKK